MTSWLYLYAVLEALILIPISYIEVGQESIGRGKIKQDIYF